VTDPVNSTNTMQKVGKIILTTAFAIALVLAIPAFIVWTGRGLLAGIGAIGVAYLGEFLNGLFFGRNEIRLRTKKEMMA